MRINIANILSLILAVTTTFAQQQQQCEDDSKGCCSNNFASCVTWCGSTRDECLACNNVIWICEEQTDCVPKWNECTNNKDGCCDGLTCVDANPYYSQCKYVENTPTNSPTNSPMISPTKFPVNTPTKSPTENPTSSPSSSPSSSPTEGLATIVPTSNCIQCDDNPAPWMIKNNRDCATTPNAIKKKCNKSKGWVKNKYCQLTCYKKGFGYLGDVCCEISAPTSAPTTQSPTTQGPTTQLPTTQSPTTQSPTTQSPTTQTPTTHSPTKSPTTQSPTTRSPTTSSPTTAAPIIETPSPTAAINFPTGPYITTENANERIVIPDPPEPNDSGTRFNCPHEATDLLDWHSSATWGGAGIPAFGENIILPSNSKVIVRQSVEGTLGVITIPSSSELIFDEHRNGGISFEVRGIKVLGKLTIGSETCRIESLVQITLHGSRPNDAVTNVREPTYKGIDVTDGGELSLHGQRYFRTWTRLATTAEPGDVIIMLQNKVDWVAGQEIVLVTTAVKDSREWHRNEVAIVKSVIQNPTVPSGEVVGAAVILQSPIMYQHVANSGYQGEVGLLTRKIVIQGSESDSEPTDPDPLNCQYNSSTSPGTTRYIYGDRGRPCPNTELSGFGGHVIIRNGSRGYVEGVELYRMGQTNVLGRYPMHFHLLNECPDCYFRFSSVHRSYYRCVSIHGTHYTEISENVAYDVSGFCYYLEDGVEHHNQISFNLGAHIHLIGPEAPWGNGQTTEKYQQSDTLTLPADVSASAFYITNIQNYIIGNAASGGWAGFAFPILPTPLGPHRDEKLRPASVTGLTIDGNTAHSSAWWWYHAAAFYWGGSLYYNSNGVLEYNSGRDFANGRMACSVNKCVANNNCNAYCQEWERVPIEVTNTKAFLAPGVGFGSWSGNMDITGYECHDCGLSMESLSDGFWINNMLTVCRTKTPLILPSSANANRIHGSGFIWYDTNQAHIITDAIFRNCGYRSSQYNQYNQEADRGCGNENDIGCTSQSSVWGMLTHSDQFVPEMMQGTKDIRFENCGRRFRLQDFRSSNAPSSVSGREQNWYDLDGTISGFGEPSVAASGLTDAGKWWKVDDEVVYEPQAPLWFFKLNNGPERGIGHFRMKWDNALHNKIGSSQCGNGQGLPCDYVGYIQHLGDYFSGDSGLPVTANADVVGPVGGFGWKLDLTQGPPKSVRFEQIEVDPSTPLLLSISYPIGTSFTIEAVAAYCSDSASYSCTERFHQVSSVEEVRNSLGNTYYVDSATGLLTFRIIQTPKNFVGRPEFFLPSYNDNGKRGQGYALGRFERDGIRLPIMGYGPYLTLEANCATDSSGVYCNNSPPVAEVGVCGSGFVQTGYDVCTSVNDANQKKYADGSISTTA